MAKGWFLLAVSLTAISNVAIASKASAQPAAPQAQAAPTEEVDDDELRRFVYLHPNRAPAVSNLSKLFPNIIEIGRNELLALLDGDKGAVARRETVRSIGLPVFNLPPPLGQKGFVPNEPDAKFIRDVRDHLANNRFRVKVYEGRNCKFEKVNGKPRFTGQCNYDAAYPLSFKNGMTRYPMTPVGFDVHALILDPVMLESGVYKGRWIHPVITVKFVRPPALEKGTDRLGREFQPCVNGFAEPAEPPKPVPPSAPAPAPTAPAPTAMANATATVNIEAPKIPRTADAFLTKCYVKRNDELLERLPRNYEDARFIGVSDGRTYTGELLGTRTMPWMDNGETREAECVDYIFRNITFGQGETTLAVREVNVPKGFRDKTGSLNIPLYDGINLVVDHDKRPIWNNEKKGGGINCGRKYWRCWIGPVVVAGVFGVRELLQNDSPDGGSLGCIGSKCGGAGKSPP